MKTYWDSSALVEAVNDDRVRRRLIAGGGLTRTHSLSEVFSTMTGGKMGDRVSVKEAAHTVAQLAGDLDFCDLTAPEILRKHSLRASVTSELILQDCEIPEENVLPKIKGMKGPLSCLTQARYGIAWGAIGAAMSCFDTAVNYSKTRIQFGKPIGSFQLIQKKLAEMLTEITKAQLLNWRLGTLMNEGKATPAQVSMAKRNGCEVAANIARDARQILGGMGITGEYSIMRHMMNMESVLTYEGTHDVHLLITGMDVTGINAFK